MFTNPFQSAKASHVLFLEAIAAGHTDKAAAGQAGWTEADAKLYATANPREYEIADNQRQYRYEEYLMATGRGSDVARVALKNETKSWVQKAEPLPAKSIEDYLD